MAWIRRLSWIGGVALAASVVTTLVFWQRTGTAAVGVDGIMRDALPDYTNASALVGLRYSF